MSFKYNGERANERLKDKVAHLYNVENLSMRKIADKLEISLKKVFNLLECHRNCRSPGQNKRPTSLPQKQEQKMINFIRENSKKNICTKKIIQKKVIFIFSFHFFFQFLSSISNMFHFRHKN